MTDQETSEVLSLLFRSFPSLSAWYEKHRATIREVWLRTLSHTDADDAVSVVKKIICGEIELPANYEFDRVAILIRRESGMLTTRRAEFEKSRALTEERFEYHQDAKTADSEFERFFPAMRAAMRVGVMRREKEITAEENTRMHEAIKRWHVKGGEMPAFMVGDQ